MLIKVNYDKLLEFEKTGKTLKNTLLKLLLAKIKGTSILFSFYVNVMFVGDAMISGE